MQRFKMFASHGLKMVMYKILSVVVLFFLVSCSKEEKEIAFSDCIADPVIYDSAATVGKLIGTWIVVKQRCGWGGDTDAHRQNVNETFNSDRSYIRTKNGQIVYQGIWHIFRYNTSSRSWHLSIRKQNSNYSHDDGEIIFCGGNLIINGYPNDGCLTYYYKN